MIKKISAVILALVLCLSIVAVLPASALEAGKDYAFRVELDNSAYAAGAEVTVNVYLDVADGKEFGAGAICIGFNSAVFDPAENVANTVKGAATTNDVYASFYKPMASATWAWQNATVTAAINGANTAAEQALYDEYLMMNLARDMTASHANAANNKNGLPSADIQADTDPLISFKLKLKDGLADGTEINVGITTGAIAKNKTYIKYYSNPGNATTVANAAMDTAFMATSATVGTVVTGPAVAFSKAQVKMTLKEGALDTSVADPIQLRVTSVITAADFTTYFSNTTTHGTDAAPTASAITSVGIVAYKGAAADFDAATAKALVTDGTAATNYAAAETDYISNASGDYTFGAIIKGSRADAFAADVTFLGFVKYLDADGNAQVIFYDAATTKAITDATVTAYIAANA